MCIHYGVNNPWGRETLTYETAVAIGSLMLGCLCCLVLPSLSGSKGLFGGKELCWSSSTKAAVTQDLSGNKSSSLLIITLSLAQSTSLSEEPGRKLEQNRFTGPQGLIYCIHSQVCHIIPFKIWSSSIFELARISNSSSLWDALNFWCLYGALFWSLV